MKITQLLLSTAVQPPRSPPGDGPLAGTGTEQPPARLGWTDGLPGGCPACRRPGLGSGQGMPVSRLTSFSLSPREHLRKLFHVLSFRDVLAAVPAHAGHPWTHKSQTHRASPLLLLPRAWVQPCMVAALLLETPPWLSVHGQAGAGSWPRSHCLSRAVAQVSPAAVTCCWPALCALQTAHHRCLQQTSAVPACGHPGSGTRCQSHHL